MRSFRKIYELEAFQGKWSVPQLKRQYNSSLYERLALSRNKEEVLKLANEGQVIEKPQDVLKNPFVLEFLGMEEKAAYSGSDLESALLCKEKTDSIVQLTLPPDANIMHPNIVYISQTRCSYKKSWMSGHRNMNAAKVNHSLLSVIQAIHFTNSDLKKLHE